MKLFKTSIFAFSFLIVSCDLNSPGEVSPFQGSWQRTSGSSTQIFIVNAHGEYQKGNLDSSEGFQLQTAGLIGGNGEILESHCVSCGVGKKSHSSAFAEMVSPAQLSLTEVDISGGETTEIWDRK